MNAGISYKSAIDQAKANAKRTGTPRYVFSYGKSWWVEITEPKGVMATVYTKVTPDGQTTTLQPKVS